MSLRGYGYLIERGFFPEKGGGGGGSTNTATVITVPEWAQPYVQQYAQQAYDLWQGGSLTTYAGDIIAPQNTDELEGIDGLATRGRYGDQVITKAIAYLEKVINGEFLDGTEAGFLQSVQESLTKGEDGFNNEIYPLIGRKAYYVGDSDPAYLAQTLAAGFPTLYNERMRAAFYAENFMRERRLQHHGLGYGVEMGKHAAIDAETLRSAGMYAREYLQTTYQLSHKLFIEQQELSIVKLEIFGNCLRALTGSQQTTTETNPEQNKFMAAVGGAVTGAMVGFYFGGWVGAAIGGIIGGVIGLFG